MPGQEAAAEKPPEKTPSTDESLKGKKFDTTNMERAYSASELEKATKLRKRADRIEQRAILTVRASVLERVGASPEAIQNAQAKIHANGGIITGIEVVDLGPAQAPAHAHEHGKPELKTLKGGGKKKNPKKAEPAKA